MDTVTWKRNGSAGVEFTRLGFGTAPLGNLYQAIADDEAAEVVASAWDSGVRYFDTAPLYGLTLAERRLGAFLKSKPRDEYTLSTKVGRLMRPCPPSERSGIGRWFEVPDMKEVFDYSYDGVLRSFEESLERLGVGRVDVLFAHDLCSFTHGSKAASDARIEEFMSGGYKAMIELREQGAVKAIGGGINEWEVCQTMVERGDFDIFLLAGRYTLLEQHALDSFLPLCKARGIGVVIGGPYNSGILATGPTEGAYYNYDPAPPEILNRTKKIQSKCAAHSVDLKVAALQFPLLHPSVVAVIPGGKSAEEVIANGLNMNEPLPSALWQELKAEGLLREDAPTIAA